MNVFKRNATKVVLFMLAAYPCIHPVPSLAAGSDDPGYRSKCSAKYKDPEGTIYYGGSFSEDCSTVEILPVRSESVEVVDVKTSNAQLCEEYEVEAKQHQTYLKQFEKDLDVESYVQKMEQLRKHRLYLAGIPVMRALFNIRSTAADGNKILADANPGLQVVPAKVWDLEIVHPKIEADLKSLPSLIGVNGPTKNVAPDAYEKTGVPVELVLSRSGACVYYDKVTKTFDVEKAAVNLKKHFPVNLQFKVNWNEKVETMMRPVSKLGAGEEQGSRMVTPPWIMNTSSN